jgi:hypothetical protein
MVVLLVAELVVVGAALARSARVGLGGAALVVFVGQLRLDDRHTVLSHTPFLGFFFTYLFRSPSFLFGLVIFVPLVTLLGERLAAPRDGVRRGNWALIALLMVGASDAKVAILPVVFGALVLYGAVAWLTDRRVPAAAWMGAALALLVMGTLYLAQYRGHRSELGLHPFAAFDSMPAVVLLKGYAAGGLPAFPGKGFLLSAGAVVFGLTGMLAPQLAGLVWILRRRWRRLEAGQIWLAAVLIAGLGLGLTLSEPGTVNELYFVFYGVLAGCLLSAQGLRLAWQSRPASIGSRRLILILTGWLVAVAALMAAPIWTHLFAGPQKEPHIYLLWYGGLLLGVIGLYAIARRRLGPARWAATFLACAAVLAVGVLDAPGDYLEPAVTGGGRPAVNPLYRPMSPDVYRSLEWVRDHTPFDAVLAVNNQWIGPARTVPHEFNYSAFSERRVFIEGWAYSQGVRDRGFLTANVNPFPERLRLNDAAFLGDGSALAAMKRDYGVRYLLVDPGGGDPVDLPELERSARVVRGGPVPVFEVR